MRILILPILVVLCCSTCEMDHTMIEDAGSVFGTTYSVIHDGEDSYNEALDSIFTSINNSLSTYLPNSDISRLNRNEAVELDDHFIKVLDESKRVHKITNGLFDPTIGAVVNAWDFGPEGRIESLDSMMIRKIMRSVGLEKVTLQERQVSKPDSAFLDFNAIAKGYAVDVVAEYLSAQGRKNYLIEIGGEIRVSGENPKKAQPWRIGIDKPNFQGEQTVFRAISLSDAAMATSGTYRKFKVDEDGNRFAHIFDTSTGYPAKTNVLSVSVITDRCMTADAFATALQAMELEQLKNFLNSRPELKVFVVFENELNELESLAINGFPTE